MLQAWPGRGYWQGTLGRQPGSLTSMLQDMSQTSQPGFMASLVRGFGSFTAGHGFLVNLIVVIALAVTGAGLMAGALVRAWRPVLRPAAGLLLVLSAAVWLLVQDLGVFGGLGTDPNSMIPFALLVLAGYLALAPALRWRRRPSPLRRRPSRPRLSRWLCLSSPRPAGGAGSVPGGWPGRWAPPTRGPWPRPARSASPSSGSCR